MGLDFALRRMPFEENQWLWGKTLQHLSCSEMNDPHPFHVRESVLHLAICIERQGRELSHAHFGRGIHLSSFRRG
jgi:hypothetical protein